MKHCPHCDKSFTEKGYGRHIKDITRSEFYHKIGGELFCFYIAYSAKTYKT